jgi:Flp pilus assembly pilin Flp
MMVKKKGQSILEYVIILAAITAAVIWAASNAVTPAVKQMFTDSSNMITSKTTLLRNNMGN